MSTIPSESAIPINLRVDPANAKVLLDFLKTLPFVEVDGAEGLVIMPSQAAAGEKPSDFAGIWQDSPRSLAEVRQRAWPKRRNYFSAIRTFCSTIFIASNWLLLNLTR